MDDHLGPRVLCSKRVMLSLSSSLLRPDPPVSTTPADFPLTGYTAGLCPTTWSGLPPRPSLLSVSTPSPRAAIPTPAEGWGSICPVFPQPQWPSPLLNWVGSCIYPDTDFRRGILTTLQCSLYAVARRVASPPGSVRPNADALAAEDIYTRACPRGDRSPPESGMTTQHPRTDTVAGLPPAGALPLQAALNKRFDPPLTPLSPFSRLS